MADQETSALLQPGAGSSGAVNYGTDGSTALITAGELVEPDTDSGESGDVEQQKHDVVPTSALFGTVSLSPCLMDPLTEILGGHTHGSGDISLFHGWNHCRLM